jgi:glutathione synthase/RimK-type ligase-like ATP-grasp enzyme
MRIDVALATCAELPEPDPDMAPLLAALHASGMTAEALPWDAPDADFASARVTVLRSTWNYPERPQRFLAWVDRVAGTTALHNPAHVVRWNAHKGYLLELAARGVPVTPTLLVRRGDGTPLADLMRARAWREVVVKPAVSAASRDTLRVGPAALERGEAHLRALAAREDVLVQPFLSSVEGHGERAVVWIDGLPTHAVRKSPRFSGDAESVSAAVPIADDEAALARQAVAAAPGPLLYARVDVARDDSGTPVVMELELIEPSLFLPQSSEALERYAAAVRRRVDEARPSRSG